MKINNETKVGILAIASILILVWGYKFLRGQNILVSSTTLYVEYANASQIKISAPVLIHGLEVGVIKNVELEPKKQQSVLVTLKMNKGIYVPKNTIAYIFSQSLTEGKAVELVFDKPCNGADCAADGDFLQGRTKGMIASMMGEPDELARYTDVLKNGMTGVLDSLDKQLSGNEKNSIAISLRDLQTIIANLKNVTGQLNSVLGASAGSLKATMNNLQSISGNIQGSNAQVKELISNAAAFSQQLKAMDLATTSKNANAAIATLDATLKNTEKTVATLDKVVKKIDSGDGTLGQLINDKKLYNNLEGLTRDFSRTNKNLDFLLQDFRLNPKRYINVSVFGKSQKEYKKPETDPAFDGSARDSLK